MRQEAGSAIQVGRNPVYTEADSDFSSSANVIPTDYLQLWDTKNVMWNWNNAEHLEQADRNEISWGVRQKHGTRL